MESMLIPMTYYYKNRIVELEITEDALRSSATGRKCRCSKAKVLSITNIDGTNSNTNRWNECAPGIHFFISRQEAVDFNV